MIGATKKRKCCCEVTGECFIHCNANLKLRRHCDTPPPDGWPTYPDGPPVPMTHWRAKTCHRLLVYQNIEICNNRIRNASITPDHVLVTNGEAQRDEFEPWFYVTDDEPSSGNLDYQPYYWADCGVAGWQTGGSLGITVTKQMIHDGWDCCRSLHSSGPMSTTNGRYRMYILMKFRRAYQVSLYPTVVISNNPESTSACWMSWIKLSYLGPITGCEFEEVERRDCEDGSYPPACS